MSAASSTLISSVLSVLMFSRTRGGGEGTGAGCPNAGISTVPRLPEQCSGPLKDTDLDLLPRLMEGGWTSGQVDGRLDAPVAGLCEAGGVAPF